MSRTWHEGRKLPYPAVHSFTQGANLSFLGDAFLERIELDYCDSELAFDLKRMPGHNQKFYKEAVLKRYDKGWHGELPDGKDIIEQATKLLNCGSKKDVEKLQGLAEKCRKLIPPLGFGRRKRRFTSDGGDELDLDRWREGAEAPWIDYNRSGTKPSPYVTLVGQFGGNCGVTPEQMFWSGACAVSMTDVLEDLGFRVRLAGAFTNYQGDGLVAKASGEEAAVERRVTITVLNVKGYDEPLRLGPTSFALCHSGYFRTFGFGMILQSSIYTGYGLGSCRNITQEDAPYVSDDTVVIVPVATDEKTAKKSIETAIEELKRQFGLEMVV